MNFYCQKMFIFAIFLCSSSLFAERVIVILGPPGVGKGTQSTLLKNVTGFTAFSPGNILRQQKQGETDFSIVYAQVKKSREIHMMLKFAIMIRQMAETETTDGMILDSWPKTKIGLMLAQKSVFKENDVLVIELLGDPQILLKRINKRSVCINPMCGKSYGHVTPEISGICDSCASPVIKRAGDNQDYFRKRVAKYYRNEQEEMLQAFHDSGYQVHQIDAMRPCEVVHAEIMALIEQHLTPNEETY